MKRIAAAALALSLSTGAALAWGDEGHKVIALIAEHYLTPHVKALVDDMLSANNSNSTEPHDVASAATWADWYRTVHRETATWHYIDLEIDDPDMKTACYGRPAERNDGWPASGGPPDCIVNKIAQFSEEISDPKTDADEALTALKFLLHLVGDLHQPLHTADHHDRGGNGVHVTADGFDHKSRDNLHAYWDTQFVEALGRDPAKLAKQLLAQITDEQAESWRQGTVIDWANESFSMAQADVYGDPPLSQDGLQHLDAAYVKQAEKDVVLQLSKAGVRLGAVLNWTLGTTIR